MQALVLVPVAIVASLLLVRRRRPRRVRLLEATVGGLLGINAAAVLVAAALVLLPGPAHSQEQPAAGAQVTRAEGGGTTGYRDLGAALAVGISAVAAGVAVGMTGSAAIGAMSQRPEVFGRSLVFVGLAEGIAIYGLIIAFMILFGLGG